MNDLMLAFGIEAWKPALTALLLPPVPWLLLALVAARWLVRPQRQRLGAATLALALAGSWASGSIALGEWLERSLLAPPAALGATEIDRLRAAAGQPGGAGLAVLVLGGGRERSAPEYAGLPNLPAEATERLRYGAWLARATGAPLAYAGGLGHAQQPGGASEAQVAARIAEQAFGVPLRWREGESADTRGNAAHAVALLRAAGVREVVLVTHGWHMPRALRAFEQAARAGAPALRVTPAPMGLAPSSMRAPLRWMPSDEGLLRVRRVWREQLGLWSGA